MTIRPTNPVLRSSLMIPARCPGSTPDGNQFLLCGGYVSKLASGVFGWLPLGHRLLSRVLDELRGLSASAGFQEVLFPLIQPLALWESSDRYARLLPVLARVDLLAGSFILNSTQEEVFRDVASARGPQVKLFQASERVRNEQRPAGGLIRSLDFFLAEWYFQTCDREAGQAVQWELLTLIEQFVRACGLTPIRCPVPRQSSGISLIVQAAGTTKQCRAARCRSCGYVGRPAFQSCPACGAPDAADFDAIEICDVLLREFPTSLGNHIEVTAGLGVFRLIVLLADLIASGVADAWARAVAPFDVVICATPGRERGALQLAGALSGGGLTVIVDDSGRKLPHQIADARFFGSPVKVVLGRAERAEVMGASVGQVSTQLELFTVVQEHVDRFACSPS